MEQYFNHKYSTTNYENLPKKCITKRFGHKTTTAFSGQNEAINTTYLYSMLQRLGAKGSKIKIRFHNSNVNISKTVRFCEILDSLFYSESIGKLIFVKKIGLKTGKILTITKNVRRKHSTGNSKDLAEFCYLLRIRF